MATDQPLLPDSEALFEGAPCGLVVTREDGTILRSNQLFSSWLGLSQSALIQRRFQDLLSIGGRIFHQTHWAPLMQMQGAVGEVKLDLTTAHGQTITLLLNGVRREHSGGALHELALFATTDRDRYERELLQARRRAEELLREKTSAEAALRQAKLELDAAYEVAQRRAHFAEQMVAIASHDLKNPLTAIKMATELLGRGERTAKENQLLGHISQSSERAQRMIADLLDLALARVGHGIGISCKRTDLHDLAERSVNELRVTFPQAVLVHEHAGVGSAELDADRVQQVIGNLVANSVAYGDLARPITITSTVTASVAMLTVHNDGEAIPEASLSKLFEPMTRLSQLDADVRSVGLGLFIVREISRAHGGDVTVSSTAEQGTMFCVSFPVSQSAN
ncbi:PAS domain-containing sensor histidine kinase [Pseudomonas sp. BP8]|uniref:PAS domain-containing sensor histidine kinase n=1 Tax=Pseudomonas sp. BP8 TaxID=2817864 RepID=UPI001AE8E81D|nr:PAS domain-containing sensor histidine kinase [Pseudomonas sp. BP8]MBP2261936.1 sigma-B regulation protein RsbU (phosphoserine phosphatase) [Pseudomonas sp. BP8]HDS1737196.1 PAS domain-containing sensor histidine kinase [Pseudomonas putida]